MSAAEPDPLPDDLLTRIDTAAEDLIRAAHDAEVLFSEAEAAYSPVPAEERPPSPPSLPQPTFNEPHPERRITYPIWYVWTVVFHLVLTVFLLAAVGALSATLAIVGWLAIDTRFGFPVFSAGAVCVGLFASIEAVATMARSFSDMLRRFPW